MEYPLVMDHFAVDFSDWIVVQINARRGRAGLVDLTRF